MPYAPFHERFPKIAEEEIRTLIIFNHPEIPDGEYSLIEAYCDEPDCDCRRVFFNVGSLRKRKIVAVIAYGWESKEYYAKWMGDDDPRIVKELKGPALNLASRQSKFAPALLEQVGYVLQDKTYLNRIKRHYKMFRETIEKEIEQSRAIQTSSKEEIPRNAPCPCGSGKKYKRCCGKSL